MKESRNLEFKSQVSNSFLKTVSAFANFGSGTILFGIDDNGNVLGLDDPVKTCLDIENLINDTIVPKPNFKLSITHKNKVVTLEVLEGDNKPYLYKGKAYRRSDTASIEVDTFELKRLVLEGSNLLFEEIESSKQDLEFSYLNQKMLEKLQEIISEQLGIEAAEVKAESNFKDDLNADSLDLFEMIMAMEEEFGVEIPSDDLDQIATVQDVMDYLKNKGVEE